jgi:hypothetical protein
MPVQLPMSIEPTIFSLCNHPADTLMQEKLSVFRRPALVEVRKKTVCDQASSRRNAYLQIPSCGLFFNLQKEKLKTIIYVDFKKVIC